MLLYFEYLGVGVLCCTVHINRGKLAYTKTRFFVVLVLRNFTFDVCLEESR